MRTNMRIDMRITIRNTRRADALCAAQNHYLTTNI